MIKIALVGAGGINSWVAHHLKDITKVFEKEKLIYIKVFDKDIVEEKNLKRQNQNFIIEELMCEKAEAIGNRYEYDFENIFITEENIDKLKQFTHVILGVDNHKTRKLIYKYCLDNKMYLLDLRANGTRLAYFVLNHDKPWEDYVKEHFSNEEIMERVGSCQLQRDMEMDMIQSGNKIIAYLGVWGIFLKAIRSEELISDDWRWIY